MVRPSVVGELQEKHVRLAGLLPVPNSHGWSGDVGLVFLEAMEGKTLRKVLETGSRRYPEPEKVINLLDRFPVDSGDNQVVKGPVTAARSHAKLLTILAPGFSEEISSTINSVESAEDIEPVGVHGDFHSSQIMVRGDQIVGLVDVDTAGRGQLADDYAGLLGQLSTLALTSPRRKTITGYAKLLLQAFDQVTDPRDLRLRTAAVILGLATGPFRVQRATWPAEPNVASICRNSGQLPRRPRSDQCRLRREFEGELVDCSKLQEDVNYVEVELRAGVLMDLLNSEFDGQSWLISPD